MIEYKIRLAGSECSVVEWNPSGNTLVFALHGWLDNLASFESLVKYMPDIRLVAFDFPGHGHSEHIVEGSAYHFVDGIFLIDDLARHFQQQQINLLGHSMGGAVSCLYAASQSQCVAKLCIIESLGPLTADPQQGAELMSSAIHQRQQLTQKQKPVYEAFSDALVARAIASKIKGTLIKPIVERGLAKVEGGYTWRADSRLRITSPMRLSEAQLEKLLCQISAPVLLIEGDAGLLTDSSFMQSRKSWFSNLTTHIFEGGHHVHLEQPQACADKIQTFFKAND